MMPTALKTFWSQGDQEIFIERKLPLLRFGSRRLAALEQVVETESHVGRTWYSFGLGVRTL